MNASKTLLDLYMEIREKDKELKIYREALQRIADTYDNVEDLAGVISREALNQSL